MRELRVTLRNVAADETILSNMESCLQRGLPEWRGAPVHSGKVALCGGAPSLSRYVDRLKSAQRKGVRVVAVNGAVAYLAKRGLMVDCGLLLDPQPIVAAIIAPVTPVPWLVASCCDPSVFDLLKGQDVTVWHAGMLTDDTPQKDLLKAHRDAWCLVYGASSAVMRGLNLFSVAGYRRFDFYGVDSSFSGRQYAYGPAGLPENSIRVQFRGRWYDTTPQMAGQFQDFKKLWAQFGDHDIRVHGSGLLPDLYRALKGAS